MTKINQWSSNTFQVFHDDIKRIQSVNQAWKLAAELVACNSVHPALANSLKNLKNRQQIRLLREHAPHNIFLKIDDENESDEPLYGLIIKNPSASQWNAGHLPIRVAKKHLTDEEIKYFSGQHSF
ncbi:MAG: hypothetical protein JJU32_18290 [Phormidium sp. BM_Day4_Bin.17]|nr:hypothetical protein [Phormidium sp. BM_Day4_Bin.17]UCJ13993.1 MAG: hypothetical protein JWS08_09870 [Phormidium sp. PBR-2020]